jgi:hypothetical protein
MHILQMQSILYGRSKAILVKMCHELIALRPAQDLVKLVVGIRTKQHSPYRGDDAIRFDLNRKYELQEDVWFG